MTNNLVYIVMDSCRYDSFVKASTPTLDRLGYPEKRFSYASWTSPSHYTLLMGLVPHTSPTKVFASEVYKDEFVKWILRLGVSDLSFKSFIPYLSLPRVLKDLGYRTIGRVSMPVLNSFTSINNFFDDYKLMSNHNDFTGIIADMDFSADHPTFYFMNLGETHYPYMLDGSKMPRISGVHGIFKGMDDLLIAEACLREDQFFDAGEMTRLHNQQVSCVSYVDSLMAELFEKCPDNTYFIITADHGELFGEDGYFGHGPIMHTKCFEVPFLEGKLTL